MRVPTSLLTLILLSACGGAIAEDERLTLISEIETCFEDAAPNGKLDRGRADEVIERCRRPMEAYSRFNIEEMFDREFATEDAEMMDFFRIHQSALKDFAFRKLTTGEGNWQ